MLDHSINLVVINSFGPMGSSLLAALIEKWGYLNLPIRGRATLPEYLIGRRSLSDPAIRLRFRSGFLSGSTAKGKGGVNVKARLPGSALINYEAVSEKLDFLDRKTFGTLAEMYDSYRELYAEGVLYKQINAVPGWHIELATDYAAYEGRNIEAAFKEHFENVVFFHMTRNFYEWCESSASQLMARQTGASAFRFGSRVEQYEEYLDSIKNMSGIRVDFEDLLVPRLTATKEMISRVLGKEPICGNLENEQFDLYGNVVDYTTAFTKADRPGTYFSRISEFAARALYQSSLKRFWKSLLFHPFYLLDLIRNRKLRLEGR